MANPALTAPPREGLLRSLASYDAAAVCSGLSALSIAERSSSESVWPREGTACSTAAFKDLPAFTGDGQRAVVLARLRTTIHDPAHASSSGTDLRNRVERGLGRTAEAGAVPP